MTNIGNRFRQPAQQQAPVAKTPESTDASQTLELKDTKTLQRDPDVKTLELKTPLPVLTLEDALNSPSVNIVKVPSNPTVNLDNPVPPAEPLNPVATAVIQTVKDIDQFLKENQPKPVAPAQPQPVAPQPGVGGPAKPKPVKDPDAWKKTEVGKIIKGMPAGKEPNTVTLDPDTKPPQLLTPLQPGAPRVTVKPTRISPDALPRGYVVKGIKSWTDPATGQVKFAYVYADPKNPDKTIPTIGHGQVYTGLTQGPRD